MMTVQQTILTAFFIICLVPFSISGLSVNYSFLLLPLFHLFIYGKSRKPPDIFLLMIGLFSMIFIVASIYQHELYDEGLRRTASFIIFMSMFSYMLIKIDEEMIESFKASIVIIGLFFSLLSLYKLLAISGTVFESSAKDLVGGQRFGFIYLLGIWLAYYYQSRDRNYIAIKYSIIFILLVGLLLTFSRSSIIALLGSFGLFALLGFPTWLRKLDLEIFLKSLVFISLAGVMIVLLHHLLPVVSAYFEERLFLYLLDSSTIMEDITNPNSSGGTRVYILGRILDFTVQNPLIGSGFFGVWKLNDPIFGSAHNQLADVLFRTGFFGFLVYMGLIILLLRYLHTHDRALFWGVVAILIYGLFHETFKESQGAFVLAFLLGMLSQKQDASKPYPNSIDNCERPMK